MDRATARHVLRCLRGNNPAMDRDDGWSDAESSL